jgi:hypothetical protein
MLENLIKLADELDKRGYTKEVAKIDALIKKDAGRHELFRALKNDDLDGAIKGLLGMNNEDLGITTQEFKFLTQDLMNAKSNEAHDPDECAYYMDAARKRVGIEKPEEQTINTHNPVTGKPWSSGPVSKDDASELDSFGHQVISSIYNKSIKSLNELNYGDLMWLANHISGMRSIAKSMGDPDKTADGYKKLIEQINNVLNKIDDDRAING